MGKSGGKNGQTCPFPGASLTDFGASLGERIGAELRRRYPMKTAQQVAADLGASIDTAENWVRGNAPSLRWFVVLVEVYGPEFLAAACPRLDWLNEVVIAAEKQAIEKEMAALEMRRRQLEGR